MAKERRSLRTKAQRIAAGQARRRAITRRAKTLGTRVSVKLPKMSKTMRTRLIYAHPIGPSLTKGLRTMKTPRTITRRVANTAMNVNRATGTRRSGRVAGNTVQLVSLNNVKKTRRVGKSKYNNLYNLFAGMKL